MKNKKYKYAKKLYICSHGQTGLPICVDLGHEYCKIKSQNSKRCDLRKVLLAEWVLDEIKKANSLQELQQIIESV